MSIFSDTLIFLRNRVNLSREELASAIEVSPAHIKRLETDYIEPDDDTINKIASFFDVTVSYLLGGASRIVTINEPGFRNVPGNFACVPVLKPHYAMKKVISEAEIIDRIVLPVPGYKKSEYIGILVDSDDLGCERIRKGDIAIVELTTQLLPNDLVAVSHADESVFFRRYMRLGPTVILTEDNAIKSAVTFDISDTEYKIIGKVIGFHGQV